MIKGIWQDENGDWWTEETFLQTDNGRVLSDGTIEFGIQPKTGGNFIRPATENEIELVS